MASTIVLTGAAARAREVELQFLADSRVLAQRNYLTIERGGKLSTINAVQRSSDGSASGTVFRLDGHTLGNGAARITLPFVPRVAFPDDGLDAVTAPTVKLTLRDDKGATATEEHPLALAEESAVAPWALLPSAAWISLASADQSALYRVPCAVTIRSVGPNPIPSGAQIAIAVDAMQAGTPVVTGLTQGAATLDPALISVTTTDEGPVRTLFLTVAEPPGVGEAQTITFSWPGAAPQMVAPGPSRARVLIVAAGTAEAPRRLVGAGECLIDDPNRVLTGDVAAKESR